MISKIIKIGVSCLIVGVCVFGLAKLGYAKTPAELCEEGDINRCFIQASILFSQSRLSESLVFYEKACVGGHVDSCFFLGHRSKSKSVERTKALNKLTEYCDQKIYAACTHFGNISMLDKDNKGMDALELACQKGDVKGCASLGYHAKKKGDMKTAEKAFLRACKSKDQKACKTLKEMSPEK